VPSSTRRWIGCANAVLIEALLRQPAACDSPLD
jgi:hypothetical protein